MQADAESNRDEKTPPLAMAVLSQREYCLLLTLLRQQALSGELAEQDFAALLYGLVAEDLAGDHWTYAPESGAWFKVDDPAWVEGEPRGPLLLALPAGSEDLLAAVAARIGKIEAAVRAERYRQATGAAPPAGLHAGVFCRNCGSRMQAAQKYCTNCGAAAGAAPTAGPGQQLNP